MKILKIIHSVLITGLFAASSLQAQVELAPFYEDFEWERDCRIQQDDLLDRSQIDLEAEKFFSQTPERLRAYYPGESYIEGYAYLSAKSGYRYLTLSTWVDSHKAKELYGNMPVDADLRLVNIEEEVITLKNIREARGETQLQPGETRYLSRYLIDKAQWKWLKNNPLDRLRIYWDKGFEEVEIFKVDMLQRQVLCIEKVL